MTALVVLAALTVGPSEQAGHLIVAQIRSSTVSWLDLSTGGIVETIDVARGAHELAISPDGRTIVAAGYAGDELSVIDVRARRVVRTLRLERGEGGRSHPNPHGVTFLSDGRTVLVTSETTGALLTVDIVEGRVEGAVPTAQRLSHMVLALPGGERALVANKTDGSVSVVDVAGSRLERIVRTGDGAQGMAYHKGRGEVWVANINDDTMSVLDAETLDETAEFPCGEYPVRVAFTDDGEHALVVCYEPGSVSVVSVQERRVVREIELPRAVPGEHRPQSRGPAFATSPMPVGLIVSGDRAYVSCTRTDTVCEIDTGTWEVVRTFDVPGEPDGLVFVEGAAVSPRAAAQARSKTR